MDILIIEDEKPASKRIIRLVQDQLTDSRILAVIESVEDAVTWLTAHPAPDLILMDIQLADGLSFDIFTQVSVTSKVIFTTAYDQYALRAFRVSAIDYLLKPIDTDEFVSAVAKVKTHLSSSAIETLMTTYLQERDDYKKRFLIKIGNQLKFVNVEDISYFYASAGTTSIVVQAGREYVFDQSLESILPN